MNKKGFTLVELLAVIVILVLIVSISIVFYNNYKKSSTNMLTKAEIAMLMDAGANYYKEFGKDKYYIYYKDTKGNTVSCVRIQSLIDSGYYKTNVKFLKEGLSYDKTVVKITENYQGVINYDLVEDYTKDIGVCTDYNYTSDISNQGISASNNENNGVSVSGNIEKDNNQTDAYNLTLNIDADVYRESIIHNQIYVLIVLDRSGSMDRGDKYKNAKNATIELSKKLAEKNIKVGFIEFANDANLKRNFSATELSTDVFKAAVYGGSDSGKTNIKKAFELAKKTISPSDSNGILANDLRFVLFLSDGIPDDCSNDQCIITAGKQVTNTGAKLIIIGYEMSKNVYKKIASIDNDGKLCNNSDFIEKNGNRYCYFNSNSNKISNLFNNIGSDIVNSYMTLSGMELYIKFNDVIRVQNGSLYDTIKFKNDYNNDFQKKYKVFIDEEKLNQKYGCSLSTCGSIPLFDENNSYIKLIGANNEDKGRIKLTSPMINIKKNEVVYVN